ncbi:MAG: NAD-dependent epimerase/dehydratase family protein [Gemmatimonas sp.]
MRIFVTGASGYAGYYTAIRLAEAGHTVTGLVRHPDQPRLDILRTHEVRLLQGDVAEPASYRAELETSDVVIHTMLDKKRPFDTDRALFGALAALPAKPRRFIYTTGCSIFGKLPVEVMDETVEPNPEHPLAFRRGMEREALAVKGVSAVVVRPGFMFGYDGYNSVSTDWFEMAESGDPVFRGDRERGWSWIHIADLAEAYRLIAEADDAKVGGEIFHLADDLRPRSLDVMRACVAATGVTREIRFEESKKGDNISTWFNQNEFITSKKARERLGWTARHPGVIDSAPTIYRSWKAANPELAQPNLANA